MPKLNFRNALQTIPPYVAAKPIEELKRELGLTEVIRLAANENDMGYSPLVREAIEGAMDTLNLYPDLNCNVLRHQLSDLLGVAPNQLIFGNGSFELLSLVAQAFINPGDESIIPEPTFGWYRTVTQLMDGIIVSVPLQNHIINLEIIKSHITDRTKVIWLCNPNNPTGTLFPADQFDAFLADLPNDIILVLDEAYYEFVNRSDYVQTINYLDLHPNIIILRTFSKVYGLASLRIGYGIADPEVVDYFNRIRLPINVNLLAQVSASAALKDIAFKEEVLKLTLEGKERFYQAFERLNLPYLKSETNFVMVDLKRDSLPIVNYILKSGYSIRPGVEFGMHTWLRITIGTPEHNSRLLQLLEEALSN